MSSTVLSSEEMEVDEPKVLETSAKPNTEEMAPKEDKTEKIVEEVTTSASPEPNDIPITPAAPQPLEKKYR